MGLINSKRNSVEAKYSTLNGIYPDCEWDPKTIRKLVMEKKVAPLYPGKEEPQDEMDECPICMLYYPGGLNRAKCCKQEICTECMLQIKKPHVPVSEVFCPFCNVTRFMISFRGPKSVTERQRERKETEKVERLEQQMRESEKERDRKRREEKRRVEKKKKAKQKAKQLAAEPFEEPPKLKVIDIPKEDDQSTEIQATNEDDSSPIIVGREEEVAQIVEDDSGSPKKDLEELMLMEAIRLSLMDTTPTGDEEEEEEEEEGISGNEGEGTSTGYGSKGTSLDFGGVTEVISISDTSSE